MRFFITGASGWIGSAVVPDLISAGHQVVGLARSDASADDLVALGAEVRRGTIDDLDVLDEGASKSDGVIHLAFKHDLAFSGGFQEAADADRRAIETFGRALANSDRPLVIASGILGLAPGRVATERDPRDDEANPSAFAGALATRLSNARLTLDFAGDGVRSVVVRLAPTVHGNGDTGFVHRIVATARDKGVAAHIGDGHNRWPAVHRFDAARLFRLAAEKAPAASVLHATGDEGVPLRDVAEVIGRHLHVPTRSIATEEAGEHFTWMAPLLALDSPASSAMTRELLGWEPTHPGLLDDLNEEHYYRV